MALFIYLFLVMILLLLLAQGPVNLTTEERPEGRTGAGLILPSVGGALDMALPALDREPSIPNFPPFFCICNFRSDRFSVHLCHVPFQGRPS